MSLDTADQQGPPFRCPASSPPDYLLRRSGLSITASGEVPLDAVWPPPEQTWPAEMVVSSWRETEPQGWWQRLCARARRVMGRPPRLHEVTLTFPAVQLAEMVESGARNEAPDQLRRQARPLLPAQPRNPRRLVGQEAWSELRRRGAGPVYDSDDPAAHLEVDGLELTADGARVQMDIRLGGGLDGDRQGPDSD